VRGEITLLIGKADELLPAAASRKTVAQRVQELMRDEKLDEKPALKQAAKEFGLSKSEAYRELQRSK
jgi:16S rRNA (cytidine1402-2'-O)-methyltransferase